MTLGTSADTKLVFGSSVSFDITGTVTIDSQCARFTSSSASIYWDGIDINSTGVLNCNGDEFVYVSYANVGLSIFNTNGLNVEHGNRILIENPEYFGVSIWSASPDITGVRVNNVQSTQSPNAGIQISHSSSAPYMENVTIQQCPRGVSLLYDAEASLKECKFSSTNTEESIFVNSYATLVLGEDFGLGNNNIDPAAGEYAISQLDATADYIYADENWWGQTTNLSSLFSHPLNVDYSDALVEDYDYAGYSYWKPALSNSIPILFASALGFERSKEWLKAINIYKEIINSTDNQQYIRQAIRYILRANDHYNKDYTELREIINEYLPKMTDNIKLSLEYILCDILVREGKYKEAIQAFDETAKKYPDNSFKVDMLARIAMIYGNDLNNHDMAYKYAQEAAAINPGQQILQGAFEAANVKYEPCNYEDCFSLGSMKQSEPDNELLDTDFEYINNSPNPFNPATTFTYAIAEPGWVELSVYSITGQKVASLVDNTLSAGTHSAVFDGSGLGSGMYFYRFQSPGLTKNGKMLLVK